MAPAGMNCRSCGSQNLRDVIDLGPMPLADRLVDPDDEGPEPIFQLCAVWCPACCLMQLTPGPDPQTLFAVDYPYYSSVSASFSEHAANYARRMIGDRRLGPESLVLEIASNDGYLLRNFSANGIPVLGIDPASGPVAQARSIGIKTIQTFFTESLAADLVSQGHMADLIVGNNVLAHVPDPNDLVRGVGKLLKPGGLATFEVPYLRDLVDILAFDTIYHEHHCYFSLTALQALFERNGLFIVNVERLTVHGGSLRVFVSAGPALPSDAVISLQQTELQDGIADGSFLDGFAERVDSICRSLRDKIRGLHKGGASIAAYGAAAKGTVLLNRCGIGTDILGFVVDLNPVKQGKLMPGVGVPILPVEALIMRNPDYVLLLAWNFADEIIAQQESYLASGGCFIVPIPELRFVRAP